MLVAYWCVGVGVGVQVVPLSLLRDVVNSTQLVVLSHPLRRYNHSKDMIPGQWSAPSPLSTCAAPADSVRVWPWLSG